MANRNILEEFKLRGIFKDTSSEEKLLKAVNANKGVYIGFDPTADSMHIGHLVQIILLKRLSQFGLKPMIIIGGGTGKIGDPSFKKDERPLLQSEQIDNNYNAMKKQFVKFLPNVEIINNGKWLDSFLMTDFLRDVGKHFTLAYLLNKDSISSRIEKGLSITEFFYTMLQAYDFYRLYIDNDCWVQCGGSDQWGNITSGLDLINSFVGKDNSNAVGLTTNLITKKNGQKFGKTESGAIWLDSNKTSDYEFYQFFLNQDDDDAYNQLRWLSFLTCEEIDELRKEALSNPRDRLLQKQLAKEMVLFVRGEQGLANAEIVTNALFSNDITSLDEKTLSTLSGISCSESVEGLNIINFLVENDICPSNREARLMIKDKSITINGNQLSSEDYIVSKKEALFEKYIILRKGKKNYFKIVLK